MTGAPIRILVVDDEPPIRKLLRMGLTAQGYEVIDAPNGKAALELLARKPHLVILDLGLPDVDGLDLLRQLRQREEALPSSSSAATGGKVARSIWAPT
jgi:two-component system KDP operon response regulator KdpE